jgi:hypothetical protein
MLKVVYVQYENEFFFIMDLVFRKTRYLLMQIMLISFFIILLFRVENFILFHVIKFNKQLQLVKAKQLAYLKLQFKAN